MKGQIRIHKDLDVWKESMKLTKAIYSFTKTFPKEEIYGLVSQMRRTAVSIPSNIAEGAARESSKDFIRFLYISLGSLAELETQCFLAKDFNYINDSNVFLDMERIRKRLLGLIRSLKYRK